MLMLSAMSEKHFHEQAYFTRDYLLPYFERHIPGFHGLSFLEIGCAEGGFLHVLHEMGLAVQGVELMKARADLARRLSPGLKVLTGDITDDRMPESLARTFGCIVLRDVIEHVEDRESLFRNIDRLLEPGGYLYVTFPPKYSPFAGHHQVGRSWLRKVPYLHLLPGSWIKSLGAWSGEYPHIPADAKNNFRTGLTLRKFQSLCRKYGLKPIVREYFLVRPVYRIRFGWKTRRMPPLPVLDEVLTSGCECLLRKSTAGLQG
ncbi:class I SAM-dependent methyltransferase [bacterium]|nr:class I SAM-dependent methyltransferase [bacterium]